MFYNLVLGRLRPLAVTTSKRSDYLPYVLTVAESGFAGFDAPAWRAILAPEKTLPEVLKRMNEEVNKALKNSAPWASISWVARPSRPVSSSTNKSTSGPRW